MDGPDLPVSRTDRRAHHSRHRRLRRQGGRVPRGRHLRDQHRDGLRLPARQHGPATRAHGAARARLRDRRRGRLDPDRRGPDAAHHLRALERVDEALLPVRQRRADLAARRRLRSRRGEAHRRSDRSRHRQGRAAARGRQPVRLGRGELRPSAREGAPGQGALPPGQGLSRGRRRGEDRRRVHGPDHGRATLVRWPAPGRRGQRTRPDPGREPHLGDGHAPELLPHVREARRDDRYRRDRGGRVRVDLPAARRADPDAPPHDPSRRAGPDLQVGGAPSSRRSSRT